MDSAKEPQLLIPKGLNTNRKTVDPGLPEGKQLFPVHRSRIAFHGNLRSGKNPKRLGQHRHQMRQLIRIQKGRRPSSEKDGVCAQTFISIACKICSSFQKAEAFKAEISIIEAFETETSIAEALETEFYIAECLCTQLDLRLQCT